MYVNKCSKCGTEFETKNPKRVICPGCLYPDRKPLINKESILPGSVEPAALIPKIDNERPFRPSLTENNMNNARPHYQGQNQAGNNFRQQGFRPQYNNQENKGFRRPYPNQPRSQYNNNQQNQFQRPFNRPFNNNRPQQGRFSKPRVKKNLLISREQVAEIEKLYMAVLPLPNPDIHEVIARQIELESNKVFFGINLVRQKLKLPKLAFPKRKLVVSSDQLNAIKNLYEPLLPLPPIGCHKIIAKQLKMDEWRVHVGIGIVRKQMGLARWNEDREDLPEEVKKQLIQKQEELKQEKLRQEQIKQEEIKTEAN